MTSQTQHVREKKKKLYQLEIELKHVCEESKKFVLEM